MKQLLESATKEGNVSIMDMLLNEYGVDPSDSVFLNAVYVARLNSPKHIRIAKMFLETGKISEEAKRIARKYAVNHGCYDLISMFFKPSQF